MDQQAKAIIGQAFGATRQTYGTALWLDVSPRQYPVLIIECLGLKMQYDALILGLPLPWKLIGVFENNNQGSIIILFSFWSLGLKRLEPRWWRRIMGCRRCRRPIVGSYEWGAGESLESVRAYCTILSWHEVGMN